MNEYNSRLNESIIKMIICCTSSIWSLLALQSKKDKLSHEGWATAQAEFKSPNQTQSSQGRSCPRRRVPAREWLTRWHWSLGCHQGLRVLLVMTGQGRACMVIVFLHTQDVPKRPVIHLTFYFGGVWFAEFRVDLVEVTQGLNSCRFGL